MRDDFGCPFAPTNGLPCYYETDKFNELATDELAGHCRRPSPSTCSSTTRRRTATSAARPGPSRRRATTNPSPAPRYPHSRSQGFDEGNVNDKPSFIREAPYLTPTEIHTYRVYYQKALESLRSVDDGVREIVDELGALHRLRNTYIIFTSDNGFFYGEHRLTGGKFLAYEPSTHLPFLMRGPGIKPGTSTGELAANIDIAPTILELARRESRQEHRRALAVPLRARHQPPHPATDPLRVLRRNQRRRRERRRAAGDSRPEPSARPVSAQRPQPSGAKASIVAPPEELLRDPPRPLQVHRVARRRERAVRPQQDPYELNNRVKDRNLFPIRNFLHRELERLETCVGQGMPGSRAAVSADSRSAASGSARKAEGHSTSTSAGSRTGGTPTPTR